MLVTAALHSAAGRRVALGSLRTWKAVTLRAPRACLCAGAAHRRAGRVPVKALAADDSIVCGSRKVTARGTLKSIGFGSASMDCSWSTISLGLRVTFVRAVPARLLPNWAYEGLAHTTQITIAHTPSYPQLANPLAPHRHLPRPILPFAGLVHNAAGKVAGHDAIGIASAGAAETCKTAPPLAALLASRPPSSSARCSRPIRTAAMQAEAWHRPTCGTAAAAAAIVAATARRRGCRRV